VNHHFLETESAMQITFKPVALATFALAAAMAGPAFAQKGETVKIAWIDPLTGLMAPVGQNQIKSFQFIAEHFNKSNPAGVKFEMVPFDNKLSPQESTNLVKAAVDQGIRYIVQGNGSGAALAIIDAVAKHNERNPGKEVVYLNYAAVDPDLTNSKCNYWHFRLDADTSMKMEALTTFMKDQKDVKKVYLINQNYAHGQQVSRRRTWRRSGRTWRSSATTCTRWRRRATSPPTWPRSRPAAPTPSSPATGAATSRCW
jgi:branched-chain amino acid transport system substrate-binding protein